MKKIVNPMPEHHSLSIWLYKSLFGKYNLAKFRSAMNQKSLFPPFLINVNDTQLSWQLWKNMDCISEVDCVQRLVLKGYP